VSNNNDNQPNSPLINHDKSPENDNGEPMEKQLTPSIIDLKNVKKITLREDSELEIEFNSTQNGNYWHSISQIITPEQISNNQELQKVKDYCQKHGLTSLNQQELNGIFGTNITSTKKPKDGNNVLLIGGIGLVLGIGVGIGLLLKKKKVKRN